MADSISSRQEAEELVENILTDNGYISKEDLASMPEKPRLRVIKALDRLGKLAGFSITTLAKNIYSRPERFVFELIQNAEDNHYENAKKAKCDPYISFEVFPHKVIIECNEDGFKKRDVKAICSLGKSSKSAQAGYIGEKGIGFKSVFMVASKVHIQSGFFSFYFEHQPGDSGMGMINPIWQDLDEKPNPSCTRITLTLIPHADLSKREEQRKLIYDQFRDLSSTLLLFLKKLKRIEVKSYEDDGTVASHVVYSYLLERADEHRATLSKAQHVPKLPPEIKSYWKTQSVAHNLARSDNRTYTKEEIDAAAFANAEVVLAFPIDKDDVPIIERQEVFAFLPIRDFGFSFLINSDFVTQASRQDITEYSERNKGLRKGIAEAFMKAVLQFCGHQTLQYQWMRYLPGTSVSGNFWTGVLQNIKELMGTIPILRPLSGGVLRPVKEMRLLTDMMVDRNLDPLFQDLPVEIYLAKQYETADLRMLSDFGLEPISMNELMKRVHQDLRSTKPRLLSTMDEDWHSRAARLLSLPFTRNWTTLQNEIKGLKIVPLENNSWASMAGEALYFGNTGIENFIIPRDLQLKLVKDEALGNENRKALFVHLGIKSVPPETVRRLIIEKYKWPVNIDLDNSVAHLRYLYYTHSSKDQIPQKIRVYDQDKNLISPLTIDMYMKISGRYQTRELLKSIQPSIDNAGAPGLEVHFLNEAYFESPLSSVNAIHQPAPSWERFLFDTTKVLQHPRLCDSSTEKLSTVFQYIAKNRSEMLLGTLKYHWPFYKNHLNPSIIAELSTVEVPCDGSQKVILCKSYLPTPELKGISRKFLLAYEIFPFVQLIDPRKDDSCKEWDFLEQFCVGGKSATLCFYLRILDCITENNPNAPRLTNPNRLFQLYEAIQYNCREDEQQEIVRQHFCEKPSIHFIGESGEASWVYPKDCRWEAPADIISKKPLEAFCKKNNYLGSDKSPTMLNIFFKTTLGISDISLTDLIDEISMIRESRPEHLTRLPDIYHQTHKVAKKSEEDPKMMRDIFENNRYIYESETASWYSASSCVWSAQIITGRISISNAYPDLEDFFVSYLGIEVTDLNMLIGEFSTLANCNASIDAFKKNIWNCNSFLADEKSPPAPESLLDLQILPIILPNGTTELQAPRTDFAILDRQKFGETFQGKAAFLDFSLQEVRTLKPFIQWLQIERFYLSHAVKEITYFGSGNERAISAPNRDMTSKLRSKAEALFRCAVHYNSPRASQDDYTFYKVLSTIIIYETDDISSSLVLSQNDKSIEVQVEKSLLYFDMKEMDNLLIYIPRDPQSQEMSFISKLPERFLEYLVTNPDTGIASETGPHAIKVISDVLQCSPVIVNNILEEAGIIPVEISPDLLSMNFSAAKNPGYENEEGAITKSAFYRSSYGGGRYSGGYSRGYSGSYGGSVEPHVRPPLPSIQQLSIEIALESRAAYKRLLEWMVEAARHTPFPTKEHAFNMNDIGTALRVFGYPGEAALEKAFDQEYEKRVGAAGELFTFELLKKFNTTYLPGFDSKSNGTSNWSNWQSTIRNYAQVHDQYSNMHAWSGTETADLVYEDNTGAFTKFLVEKEYLSGAHWENAKPKYFFEVKTTPSKCKTPFFMSNKQYERMKRTTEIAEDGSGFNVSEVYIIFRIFNIDKDSLDLKVYVDPRRLKKEHKLRFTMDRWTVVPRRS